MVCAEFVLAFKTYKIFSSFLVFILIMHEYLQYCFVNDHVLNFLNGICRGHKSNNDNSMHSQIRLFKWYIALDIISLSL